jgi:gliding motility-associated-like protein
MRTIIRTATITVIILLIVNLANAQLCQGSLGDPIVNITFGSGPNPGRPFSAATTTYAYTSADCPTDGYYAIRNSTSGCFGAWHTIAADHTGDPNGYFMLVNASYAPSAFYLDTVHGLCSNTTFEFAAWIANVLVAGQGCQPSIQPDLTFTIEKTDGTILQTFNTGGIPEQAAFTWQQMGFYFVTPPGIQDVVLRIVNNAPGGCGNDLALDDITFRPCGPTIMASIDGSPTNSLSFCAGSVHALTFTGNVLSGLSNPALQWQQNVNGGGWQDIPGATSNILAQNYAANQTPGTYQYRLGAVEAGSLTLCRTTSQVLSITIMPTLSGTVTSNAPLCAGNTLLLSVTGSASYRWTGVNGFTATGASVSIPDVQPAQSGKYYVQASAAGSCPYSDSVTVSVSPAPVATASPDTSICQHDSVQLTSSGGTTYQWLPSTGLSAANIANPVAVPADTTSYMVIVSTSAACSDTAYVVINVASAISVNAGPDQSILKGETATLKGTVNGDNSTYSWTPVTSMTDAASLTPRVNPPADIDYILSVTSNAACGMARDTVHVFVFPDIYIPNAFTPNGDGRNDTWHIPALKAIPVFELSVFNRWGQMIYHIKNNDISWNGQFNGIDQPTGGYAYMLNIGNGKRILKGVVMLLR